MAQPRRRLHARRLDPGGRQNPYRSRHHWCHRHLGRGDRGRSDRDRSDRDRSDRGRSDRGRSDRGRGDRDLRQSGDRNPLCCRSGSDLCVTGFRRDGIGPNQRGLLWPLGVTAHRNRANLHERRQPVVHRIRTSGQSIPSRTYRVARCVDRRIRISIECRFRRGFAASRRYSGRVLRPSDVLAAHRRPSDRPGGLPGLCQPR
ncbi:MAG: hypothetical protein FGM52_08990 [Mycobacterium sp.]|nr:hypothetical protein [Mycobacterium sp.]